MLLISVYAPQAVSLKRSLWGYLTTIINRWNGECIVMGDFNEVMRKEDRISLYVGSSIGIKMSKLDRFLVSDGLLSVFPHISAVCLDRHLSDHRPILLCEVMIDYGATPFRFFLLVEIRKWIAYRKKTQMSNAQNIRSKLRDIDKSLDQGEANDDLLASRMELLNQLHDFKTAETTVKGVMIDGEWVDEPNRVKEEFRDYFVARFNEPGIRHGHINYTFPNRLNKEHVADLETPITRDEIRLAVWGCEENKSPGPDGGGLESTQLSQLLDLLDSVVLSNSDDRWVCDLIGEGLVESPPYPYQPVSSSMEIDVTRSICKWWNLGWVPVDSYLSWLSWFNSIRMQSSSKIVLEGVFYTAWWSIWMYRNHLLFADSKPRKEVIFDDIASRSFLWCIDRGKHSFRWDSWLQHPFLILL
nr:RNA-directed DNA polymerase, eukaryota [Tanacetum cinerariifolium]